MSLDYGLSTMTATAYPQFQNNPSSGYWKLVQTKFGQKEKEEKGETEQTNKSPHFLWET